ncbi:hypothetical protein Tco_1352305 [Tanacetum coccineum]
MKSTNKGVFLDQQKRKTRALRFQLATVMIPCDAAASSWLHNASDTTPGERPVNGCHPFLIPPDDLDYTFRGVESPYAEPKAQAIGSNCAVIGGTTKNESVSCKAPGKAVMSLNGFNEDDTIRILAGRPTMVVAMAKSDLGSAYSSHSSNERKCMLEFAT